MKLFITLISDTISIESLIKNIEFGYSQHFETCYTVPVNTFLVFSIENKTVKYFR